MIAWFANDRRRWEEGRVKAAEGEGGGSWSCQMGEGRVPRRLRLPFPPHPTPAGQRKHGEWGPRGVRVLDRHLG